MNFINMFSRLTKYETIANSRTEKFLERKELSDSFYVSAERTVISSMLKSMEDINLGDKRLSLVSINHSEHNFAMRFQYAEEKDLFIKLGDEPDTLHITSSVACFTISKFCGYTEMYNQRKWYCDREYDELSKATRNEFCKYSSETTPEIVIGVGKELEKIVELFNSLRKFEVNCSNCNSLK